MKIALRLLSLAVALLLWEAVSRLAGPTLVPTPLETAIAAQGLLESGELGRAVAETLGVFLAGYALAAFIGVAAGALMGGIPMLGFVLDPFANALAATPRVAFIPLIIALLGLGFDAKVAIVALGASMPILTNAYLGISQGDPELVEMARSVGAGRSAIFRRVLLPAALPTIVAGLRIGATIGLINTVVAELYTALQGLGGLLAIYGNSFRMAQYFAIVLVLAAIGSAATQTLKAAEASIGRWRAVEL
jgi:NitT/TauT family transport system permease protein